MKGDFPYKIDYDEYETLYIKGDKELKIPNTDLTTTDPIYPCPLCTKIYFQLGSLSNHVKNKHPKHYATQHFSPSIETQEKV